MEGDNFTMEALRTSEVHSCLWQVFAMHVHGDCVTDSPLDGGLSRSESRWIGGAM